MNSAHLAPDPKESERDLAMELERLRREHLELKARLSELNSRLYLSAEEEVERKTIQKLKLSKKDQICILAARLGEQP